MFYRRIKIGSEKQFDLKVKSTYFTA